MRSWIWKLMRDFLYRLDAERAHEITIRLIRWIHAFAPWMLNWISGTEFNRVSKHRFLGRPVLSPVGLAAGFDKNAEILRALPRLGFGFVEIGTVTPLPQPGNDRPRLFRDLDQKCLFNRMGFNSDGAQVVSERLKAAKPNLPSDFLVGVNIGKNKTTPNEKAAADYALALEPFLGWVDYVVINVSSPNTPGLRELQKIDTLEPIIRSVLDLIRKSGDEVPVLLKLAPEVEDETLTEVIRATESWGIHGWVLTNTLAGEYSTTENHRLGGGWSGSCLTEKSAQRLDAARKITEKTLVSVGGILKKEDASDRFEKGANAVQIYSGWILSGPELPNQIVE